jgi:hypothetical protein
LSEHADVFELACDQVVKRVVVEGRRGGIGRRQQRRGGFAIGSREQRDATRREQSASARDQARRIERAEMLDQHAIEAAFAPRQRVVGEAREAEPRQLGAFGSFGDAQRRRIADMNQPRAAFDQEPGRQRKRAAEHQHPPAFDERLGERRKHGGGRKRASQHRGGG